MEMTDSYIIQTWTDTTTPNDTDLLMSEAIYAGIYTITFLLSLICLLSTLIIFLTDPTPHLFPKKKLKYLALEEFEMGKYNETCGICLENFRPKEEVRVLPCKHAFHKQCVDKWITERLSCCPFCKRQVKVPDSNTSTSMQLTPSTSPTGQAQISSQPGPSGIYQSATTISTESPASSTLSIATGQNQPVPSDSQATVNPPATQDATQPQPGPSTPPLLGTSNRDNTENPSQIKRTNSVPINDPKANNPDQPSRRATL